MDKIKLKSYYFLPKIRKSKLEYWTLNMMIFKSKNIIKDITYLGSELAKNVTGEYQLKMINQLKVKLKFLY